MGVATLTDKCVPARQRVLAFIPLMGVFLVFFVQQVSVCVRCIFTVFRC